LAAYLPTWVALRVGLPAVHVGRHGRPRGLLVGRVSLRVRGVVVVKVIAAGVV